MYISLGGKVIYFVKFLRRMDKTGTFPLNLIKLLFLFSWKKGNISEYCFQHNHGNITTERSPKSGQCPTLIEWPQGLFTLHSTIDIIAHSMPLISLEYCVCTTSITNIQYLSFELQRYPKKEISIVSISPICWVGQRDNRRYFELPFIIIISIWCRRLYLYSSY